jgi:hypothetical protein
MWVATEDLPRSAAHPFYRRLDTATSIETLIEAAEQVETVVPDGEIKEVVADKGYHRNQVMVDLEAVGVRSYISEPDRGRRNWKDHPDARDAVYRNRRRIRGAPIPPERSERRVQSTFSSFGYDSKERR